MAETYKLYMFVINVRDQTWEKTKQKEKKQMVTNRTQNMYKCTPLVLHVRLVRVAGFGNLKNDL